MTEEWRKCKLPKGDAANREREEEEDDVVVEHEAEGEAEQGITPRNGATMLLTVLATAILVPTIAIVVYASSDCTNDT